MITPGSKFEVEFSYSQKDVDSFANLTGDNNPIHLDPEYASNTIFKKPIIHGFLGGAIFSRILGTEFPGEGTVYLQQTLDFKRPMFVDVNYKAIVSVKEIYPEKNRALMETIVVDAESGKKVISGEALVMNKNQIF